MNTGEQAHITVYTLIGRPERVKGSLTARFSEMTKKVGHPKTGDDGVESIIITLRDGSDIKVNINSNKDFIQRHIGGMYNFFAQVKCENRELHQSVLHQIEVFNCVVGVSFDLDDNEDRTNYIVGTMFGVAEDINGLVLMPDMRLLRHDGELVLSAEGESDLSEYIPTGNADFLDGQAEDTPADTVRRERSITVLKEKGIPYLPQLPPVTTGLDTVARPPEKIAERLLAMFGVCVYCEVRSGGETWEGSQKYLERIDEILGGRINDCLTAQEKAFLAVKKPEQRDLAKFGWRYECCHVLMWALGITEELGYPDRLCDVSAMGKVIWRLEGLSEFLERARPRSGEDVLDTADLMLRYDWACVDARLNGRESPAGLNGEVVYEWHLALNWLIGAEGDIGWDEVKAHT